MTDFRRQADAGDAQGGGAGGWGGDAYPAEQPQAEADAQRDHDAYMPLERDYSAGLPERPPVEYRWSMTGTHISVSGDHAHNDLFDMMGHSDPTRPHAWGTVQVSHNWEALWQIEASNMSLGMVEKRLKKYSKDQGWQHVTIIDHEGQPFMGIKTASLPQTFWHITNNPHLVEDWEWQRDRQLNGQSARMHGGVIHLTVPEAFDNWNQSYTGGRPYAMEVAVDDPNQVAETTPRPGWTEYQADIRHVRPLRILPIEQVTGQKTASDPGVGDGNYPDKAWKVEDWPADLAQDVDYYGFTDPTDEEQPRGPFSCSHCQQVFPDFSEWRDHVDRYHINPQREPNVRPHPVIDMDEPMPADFNTSPGINNYNTGMPFLQGAVQYIKRHFVLAAGKNEMIPGPMPFVFDIENDKVITGPPGGRHSDIKGQFTPGGVVEGLYLPNGKMQFRTDTDMPYTVRHMVQLWQAMHPELEVKSVEKLVNGKPYRLASANIAHKVRNLAMADDAVANVYSALERDANIYVVGGAVRDTVLGRVPKDVDLMVQGMPMHEIEARLQQLPGRVDITGKAFGVLRYRSPDGGEVEIALPRKEQSSGQGHKDFEVQADPYMTADEDLSRRDFTGNSMCVNLKTGELLDPFHGAEDLKARRLRTTWPGAFREDPLRTVRALASVSRHGLYPDEETKQQMAEYAPQLAHLPNERIQAELDKVFGGDDPEAAMRLAIETGVIHHIMPEFSPAVGFDQMNKHHRLPLDQHSLQVLRGVQEQSRDKDLRLAAFMHDIGKPGSFWQDDDGWGHYYRSDDGRGHNHEELGANITRAALTRLKYPNARIDRVTHLVANHMFAPFDTPKAARRRINQVGADHIMDLLKIRRADGEGKGTTEYENRTPVDLQENLAQQVMDEGQPTSVSSLVINGNDLINLGIKPGPQLGQILNALADRVIDDPGLNNRHDLLALAQQMSENQDIGQVTSNVGKSRHANILDPIQDSLDPEVFDDADKALPKVKPKIAQWVKSFVFKTMREAGWPDPEGYVDIDLTGSLTTYQWAITSDFDVSLWVQMDHFPEFARWDLIQLMIEKCDGTIVPGTSHPIQCFVVDTAKFKTDDLYQPGMRSAYDLQAKRWIVPPERNRSHDVAKEFPAAYAYAMIVRDKIEMALKYDPPLVKVLWDNLHRQRRNDMIAGLGDYSGSNIAYKLVANSGLHPAIEAATGEHIA